MLNPLTGNKPCKLISGKQQCMRNSIPFTWELVDQPTAKRPIDMKWIFKLKVRPDGSIAKHKARLVARAFLQKEGLDFSEVYAPVARM